jgi:hypothetical protein
MLHGQVRPPLADQCLHGSRAIGAVDLCVQNNDLHAATNGALCIMGASVRWPACRADHDSIYAPQVCMDADLYVIEMCRCHVLLCLHACMLGGLHAMSRASTSCWLLTSTSMRPGNSGVPGITCTSRQIDILLPVHQIVAGMCTCNARMPAASCSERHPCMHHEDLL